MKEKKSKFSLEKFEVVRLKDLRFFSGGDGTGGDPDTGTLTSSKCSTKPTCKDLGMDDPVPPPPPPPKIGI